MIKLRDPGRLLNPSLATVAVALAATLLANPSAAQEDEHAPAPADWSGFRGQGGSGVLRGGAHPIAWSDEENVAWRAELPGGGWSSPVTVGNRVFVTTATGHDAVKPRGFRDSVAMPASRGAGVQAPDAKLTFHVLCFDLDTGEELWREAVGSGRPKHGVHPSNTYATESPATDGQRVFATFGSLGDVVALDLDGHELWRTEVGSFKTNNDFGSGSSLRAGEGKVFVQMDNDEESFVTALDAETGEVAWRADRPKGTSWATPLLWTHGDGDARSTELVCLGRGTVRSYEPHTGDVLWTLDGWNGSFCASPAGDEDGLYFGNSGPGIVPRLMSVKPGAHGEHSAGRGEEPEIASWSARRGAPGFASPLAVGGLVYTVASPSVLYCFDAKTGERVYQERLRANGSLVASPWSDGEHIFVLDESGKTNVVRAGREFELVRTNEVDGLFWGTPSVAGRALLLRAADELICIRAD